jgi:thymidylate synthase
MIIEGSSIANCWLKALIQLVDGKTKEISPFIANIKFSALEHQYENLLKADLDSFLRSKTLPEIYTTANTIFPLSLSGGDRSVYERFDKVWKSVKSDGKNRYGHYFRRLTSYGEKRGKSVNQLQHIIETFNGIGTRQPVHRRSALIATTFDPLIDHTSQPMRGFPCLQQVCFIPNKEETLSLNAIYAMQHLSDRAYGNYLGLQRLGEFVAKQTHLTFTELNCIASVLSLGSMSKSQAGDIVDKYRNYV